MLKKRLMTAACAAAFLLTVPATHALAADTCDETISVMVDVPEGDIALTVDKANLVVTVTQRLDKGYEIVSVARVPLQNGVTSSYKGGGLILTQAGQSTSPLSGQNGLNQALDYTEAKLAFVQEGDQIGFRLEMVWQSEAKEQAPRPLSQRGIGGTGWLDADPSDFGTYGRRTHSRRTIGLGNGYQWKLSPLLQVKIGAKERTATLQAIGACTMAYNVDRFKPELSTKTTARR